MLFIFNLDTAWIQSFPQLHYVHYLLYGIIENRWKSTAKYLHISEAIKIHFTLDFTCTLSMNLWESYCVVYSHVLERNFPLLEIICDHCQKTGRSEGCLVDVCILYLWECAHCCNTLWNHTAESNLKNQILRCARGRKC